MKNFYILFVGISVLFSANGFAQKRIAKVSVTKVSSFQSAERNQSPVHPMNTNDTITAHWDVIYPMPSVDTAVTYSDLGGGFVAGQDSYLDKAKAQKFDATYGVTSSNGSITNLLMWVGAKIQATTPGNASWVPTIWADNAGKPGTVLGTSTAITVAQMDTSSAALQLIGPITALKGAYNLNAAFSPAVAIPVNQIFWAGYTITYDSGDSAGLVSSTNGNFPDAVTHTFEQWSDNSWNSFNDGTTNSWQSDVALAVYPVVSIATHIEESNSSIASVKNVPNPANDNTIIYYLLKESSNVELSLFDVTGKKLMSTNEGLQASGNHKIKLDVSSLLSGVYFYTISAGDFKMTSKMSVVK